jgi:hypothetical protein
MNMYSLDANASTRGRNEVTPPALLHNPTSLKTENPSTCKAQRVFHITSEQRDEFTRGLRSKPQINKNSLRIWIHKLIRIGLRRLIRVVRTRLAFFVFPGFIFQFVEFLGDMT